MTLDWLIIGGGIHGVHIATRLMADADIPADRLRIVDPGPRLLARWHDCTRTTGMTYLRSPSVHHLDVAPMSLQNFAGTRQRRDKTLFTAPYDRPSLQLFNDHCDKLTRDLGLANLQIRASASACVPGNDGVTVSLSDGRTIHTRNVVLALGAGDQPAWPDWAPRDHDRVHHVFEPGFAAWPTRDETTLVVGGGISAGHVSLRLVAEGHRPHLISRHELRIHQFDSDPGWLGPKYTVGFHQEPDHDRRRAVITKARHRGSMTPDMGRAVRRGIARSHIQWHEAEVTAFEEQAGRLSLRTSVGTHLAVDRILLATGFARRRPGGSMIDGLIASASLPCASCGYPIVDESLRWHPGVYVSGPLAELELGPVSRNIAGARRAGDRIAAAARASNMTMKSAG
ncbi:MAG: FAD/NAD(P)-binding protein [Planctomycetota bacterium]|nr:FAD/NAD(P)-binding protein [Planctomycetota bacterium]